MQCPYCGERVEYNHNLHRDDFGKYDYIAKVWCKCGAETEEIQWVHLSKEDISLLALDEIEWKWRKGEEGNG